MAKTTSQATRKAVNFYCINKDFGATIRSTAKKYGINPRTLMRALNRFLGEKK